MDNILTMKKLLTLIFVAFAFASQAQPIQADPNVIIGEDSNYADYWDIKATTDRLDIDGVGIASPIIRLVDYIGPKLIYVNASGDLTLISDGTSGQALTTNGSGTYSFSTVAATPGGSTTQLQYNNAGAFGGITGATTNGTSVTLTSPTISGGTINNTVIGGTTAAAGSFTTLSTSAATTLTTANNSPLIINRTGTNGTATTWQLDGAAVAQMLVHSTNYAHLYGEIGKELRLGANGLNNNFSINTSGNATFSGTVSGAFNGTIGATTPSTGAFTGITSSGSITFSGLSTAGIVRNSAAGLLSTSKGTASQLLRTNSGATDVEWFTPDYVTKVGTPVDNQVGVWTGSGTLEGDADLTFSGTRLTGTELQGGNIAIYGSVLDNGSAVLNFGTAKMWTSNNSNFGVGSETFGTSAVNVLGIQNGTAPTTSPVDMVQLYAEDVAASSELKVRDEVGNITVLGPHSFIGIPEGRSEEMAWAFYSERDGKYINVDMAKAMRTIEDQAKEIEELKKMVYQLAGKKYRKKQGVKLVHIGSVDSVPNPNNK